MNTKMILSMLTNKTIWRTFYGLHQRFRQSPDYRLRYLVRCSANVLAHDPIVRHERHYLVNTFLPPLDTPAFAQAAFQVPGEGAAFYRAHITGERCAPISTYVAVTDQCRYHCWHCSAAGRMQSGEVYSTAQLIQALADLQRLGVGIIGLTGGEPLLRDDLETVLRTVDERSVTYLFTSGYSLTLKRARALKEAGLFGLAVSVDAMTPETHDGLRGYPGAWEQAMQAIRCSKEAGLYTMVQTVGRADLIGSGEIYELAHHLQRMGVDELRITEPTPAGRLAEHSEELLTDSQRHRLRQIHAQFNRDRKHYPKTAVFPYIEAPFQYGCGAGVQHSYLDCAGNFGPCDFLPETYGNIFEEDITVIWERMHQAMLPPKRACLARCPHQAEALPDYYRLMAGEKCPAAKGAL